MIELAGAHLEEALSMATQVPARLLGRDDLGRIAPGCQADLVLWDTQMQVVATYVDGRLAFGR
jgi:N-acetylglucosamine-6-phosphate deacetylase